MGSFYGIGVVIFVVVCKERGSVIEEAEDEEEDVKEVDD